MADSGERCEGYWPIAAYAAIGDCHTAALIAPDGSIDWYCPDRFDAPAVFCRILDTRRGGYLRLIPAGQFSAERRYIRSTNVLETVLACDDGRVRLMDFMPVHRPGEEQSSRDVGTSRRILRLVECLAGDLELRITFKPTFDYARAETQISVTEGGAIARWDSHYLTLASPGVALSPDGNGGLSGTFCLKSGQRSWIALTKCDDTDRARDALAVVDADRDLERTVRFWQDWAAGCTYRGTYLPEVERSALALKLLTYEPSGAIVAAPTTSLPEAVGGVRNWDYRYSWLRDSALMKYALTTVGFDGEARDFFRWLLRTRQSGPEHSLQIMYTVDGGSELSEEALDGLEGYRCSKPVRIGNLASRQSQLDVFGEVLSAAHMYFRREGIRPSPETWDLLRGMVDNAARRWREPDNSIWEVRGGPQLFLHSRLMCWVALDRGIRLSWELGMPAPLNYWIGVRDAIRGAILEHGFNNSVQAFTQAFGSEVLDASALLIPRIGFLPANDPRVLSTIDRIRSELTRDGLIHRYLADDGLPGQDAPFVLCNFWMVDALALGGRLGEAEDLFKKILGYSNDVGLLSEEIDPASRQLLGNFPQGFSHMGLISSAVTLMKIARHGAEEEPETEADRAERASVAVAG